MAILVGIFASGTPVEKRQTKYITQEFQDTRVRSLEKRDESIGVDDFHQRHVVHVKVGSSQQDIRAHIDTGSIRWEIQVLVQLAREADPAHLRLVSTHINPPHLRT